MSGEPAGAVGDELYGLTPAEFVHRRDARVAEAKQAGDKDLARAIGGFRRPTKSAWLVNLLSRHRGDELAELEDLRVSFQAAHREASAEKLHELSSRRTRLLEGLREAARRLAEDAGESAGTATLDEVEATLAAVVADPAAADQVRAGRLAKPLSYAAFDLSAITPFSPAGPSEAGESGSGPSEAGESGSGGSGSGGSGAGSSSAGTSGVGSPSAGASEPDAQAAARERARERERVALRKALVSAESDRDRAAERTARLRDELSGAENRLWQAEDALAELRSRLAELAESDQPDEPDESGN